MAKFHVTYTRKVTFDGTIEADSKEAARSKWDQGYTPPDEIERDHDGEDLVSIEELE